MDEGCGSEFYFGCGYDGESVFPPDRRPVGVGALEKIGRLPSSLGTASCSGGEMPSAENCMVANVSYNRMLQRECARVSIAERGLEVIHVLDLRGGEGDPREVHLRSLS